MSTHSNDHAIDSHAGHDHHEHEHHDTFWIEVCFQSGS